MLARPHELHCRILEGRSCNAASILNRDGDDVEVSAGELPSETIELREGFDTRPTPDRPKGQQDNLALELESVEQCAVQPRGLAIEGQTVIGF